MNLFQASLGNSPRVAGRYVLVIINGESNSGGYAPNSEAPSEEVGSQPQVQILNNNSLVFEDLNIGVNNLLDHAGLPGGNHGFELELAVRSLEDSTFYKPVTHLIKTGQGGSMISQWNVGGAYFNKFVQRIEAAQNEIEFNRVTPVILFSLGINDAISGTNVNTWKAGVIQHFINLREVIGLGNVPIIMTEFQGMGSGGNQYSSYITAIREIAAEVENVYSVDVSGAALRDTNHWNYAGMKLVAGRLLDEFESL